jgi:hypothetical protein
MLDLRRYSLSEHNDDLPEDDDMPEGWPKIGDRLFVPTLREFPNIATFSGERIYRMKKAFKNAADLLVTYTEEITYERRNLVWPIVFCYRQYIELALKDVINGYGCRTEPKIKPIWNKHSFKILWPPYKQIIGSILSTTTADELPGVLVVESCIYEFEKIDDGSFTFRYPTDTQGLQIDIPFGSVDIFHLRDVMERIYNFFDCTEAALDAYFNPYCP